LDICAGTEVAIYGLAVNAISRSGLQAPWHSRVP
jgi:hypothetical protein